MAQKSEAAPKMMVTRHGEDGAITVLMTHDHARWISNDIDKIGKSTAICADLRTLGIKMKELL